MSLRRKLADFGFESNEDYDYALRCLFDAEVEYLRLLHVEGRGGRRKTAFANALARALEYPHILYHDFGRPPEPTAVAAASADDVAGPAEPALTAFERVVSEACAYSEAERTVLILDQLQAADFADQVRLVQLGGSGEWTAGAATMQANPRNLLIMLISEAPLYHSLARLSYRVWTDAVRATFDFRPEDYGLGKDAAELFVSLGELFVALGGGPTATEFGHLLDDALNRVRSEDQLRQSIFGWTEQIDRDRLYAPEVTPYLVAAVDALARYIGLDHIEMTD